VARECTTGKQDLSNIIGNIHKNTKQDMVMRALTGPRPCFFLSSLFAFPTTHVPVVVTSSWPAP
jgi:hypothetical protein